MTCPSNTSVFQDTCSYYCDRGYQLEGNRQTRCDADQTWSSEPVTCTILKCNDPEVEIANSQSVGACDVTYGSNCSLNCSSGFSASGNGEHVCDDVSDEGTSVQWRSEGGVFSCTVAGKFLVYHHLNMCKSYNKVQILGFGEEYGDKYVIPPITSLMHICTYVRLKYSMPLPKFHQILATVTKISLYTECFKLILIFACISKTETSSDSTSGSGVPIPVIAGAGGGGGAVLFVIILLCVVFLCCKHRSQKKKAYSISTMYSSIDAHSDNNNYGAYVGTYAGNIHDIFKFANTF